MNPRELNERTSFLVEALEKILTAHTDSLEALPSNFVRTQALATCLAKNLASAMSDPDDIDNALYGLSLIPWRELFKEAAIEMAAIDSLGRPQN
jgi:hypothetical protein